MMLTVSGIRVHYEIVGDSEKGDSHPAGLFLHGWGGTHKSLMSLAQYLKDGCSCYLLDLPGFGATSYPPPTWGIREYTAFIKAFIDKVGVSCPIFLVGHSFGGALALSVAATYPDAISKLVVCAPSWHRSGETQTIPTPRPVSRILHKFPIVRKVLYKILFPRSDILQMPQLEANFKKIVREDLTPLVKTIQQNTLILWGKNDTYVPTSDASLLHEYIQRSVLTIYPDMKHDLPIRNSDMIAPSVYTFLTTKTLS